MAMSKLRLRPQTRRSASTMTLSGVPTAPSAIAALADAAPTLPRLQTEDEGIGLDTTPLPRPIAGPSADPREALQHQRFQEGEWADRATVTRTVEQHPA